MRRQEGFQPQGAGRHRSWPKFGQVPAERTEVRALFQRGAVPELEGEDHVVGRPGKVPPDCLMHRRRRAGGAGEAWPGHGALQEAWGPGQWARESGSRRGRHAGPQRLRRSSGPGSGRAPRPDGSVFEAPRGLRRGPGAFPQPSSPASPDPVSAGRRHHTRVKGSRPRV